MGIDYAGLKRAAIAQCPGLLEKLLPGGKLRGHEYVCSDIGGGAGESCSVNWQTGAWADFAADMRGGDLIDLVAAQYSLKPAEAATRLASMIGYDLGGAARPNTGRQEKKLVKVIQPVPDGVSLPEGFKHFEHGLPTERYEYRNRDGQLLGYVCRFTKKTVGKNGKPDKAFSQLVYTSQGWRWKDFLKPYPFYNAQKLPEWAAGAPIIVVEGEHKADALYRLVGPVMGVLGLYGGSGRAADMACSLLANRNVVFWPDNDAPGFKAALKFVEKAREHAASVKIMRLPKDVKPTWDAADAVAEGWDRERIVDWLGANRLDIEEFKKLAREKSDRQNKGLVCLDVNSFIRLDIPPRKMLLAPIIQERSLNMLHAARGVGKTYIGLCIAWAVASGGKLFDRWEAPKAARVLYIDGEMPASTMQDRIMSISAGSEKDMSDPANLWIFNPDLQDGPMPDLATPEGQEAVESEAAKCDLVIVDNIATLCRSGRANDEEAWRPVQAWGLNLKRRGKSVLFIHHQGKNGDQGGSSAKEDVLDTIIALKRPSDYETEQGCRFEVAYKKCRGFYGKDALPFEARLVDKDGLKWETRNLEDCRNERIRQMLDDGMKDREIAEELGINRSTVFRAKKKLGLCK